MIYQLYQTFGDYLNSTGNQNGLDQLILYVNYIVPVFIPLLLFAIFIVGSIGGYFSQKSIDGRSNFWLSMAVGGYLTTILAMILSLIPTLISGYILAVCFVVDLIFTALALLQDDTRGSF